MKLATTVSDIPLVLSAIAQSSANRGLRPSLRGSAALGLLYVGIPADAEVAATAAFVADMRLICERRGAVHSCYGRHEMSKMSSTSGVRSGRSSS